MSNLSLACRPPLLPVPQRRYRESHKEKAVPDVIIDDRGTAFSSIIGSFSLPILYPLRLMPESGYSGEIVTAAAARFLLACQHGPSAFIVAGRFS